MPNAELGTKPMQAQGFRGTVPCQPILVKMKDPALLLRDNDFVLV